LEEQVRGVSIEGNVAHLVHDQPAVTAEPEKFYGKFSPRVGLLQASDPAGGSVEQHSMVRKLSTADRALATGDDAAAACRELGVSEQTPIGGATNAAG
jgi:hypothetical protein